jgi:hypothetical protein
MPENKIKKYIISCYTTTNYYYVITAPNAEAARRFYHGSEVDNFHQGDEDGWELGDIEEIEEDEFLYTEYAVDVAVDKHGDTVVPEELPDDCGG